MPPAAEVESAFARDDDHSGIGLAVERLDPRENRSSALWVNSTI